MGATGASGRTCSPRAGTAALIFEVNRTGQSSRARKRWRASDTDTGTVGRRRRIVRWGNQLATWHTALHCISSSGLVVTPPFAEPRFRKQQSTTVDRVYDFPLPCCSSDFPLHRKNSSPSSRSGSLAASSLPPPMFSPAIPSVPSLLGSGYATAAGSPDVGMESYLHPVIAVDSI